MKKYFLFLDFETYSEADLSVVGADEYAKHRSTEIVCAAWKLATREVALISPTRSWCGQIGQGDLSTLKRLIADPTIYKVAHNAGFDRGIAEHVLGIKTPINRWICSASLAASHALPRNLGGACDVLKLERQKNKEGKKLINRYCKPKRPSKKDPSTRYRDREGLIRFLKYCCDDVNAMVGLFLDIPPLSASEREVWKLNQRINTRGVNTDQKLICSALKMIEEETVRLDAEMLEITNGEIESGRKIAQVRKFLAEAGCELPNLQKKTVEDAVSTGLVQGLERRILQIRLSVSKTSTAKYVAFRERTRSDGRVRDLQMYHGASTGRESGTGVQPHNLPRPTLDDIPEVIEDIRTGDTAWVRALHGDVMEALSSSIRGAFIASPGFEIFAADFNAIEARVVLWMAGDTVGLRAFESGDPYKAEAAKIFRKPIEAITDEQRAFGKAVVLGCLAEGTLVLTQRGEIPIEKIEEKDQLWDGHQWVSHGGVVPKGLKAVMPIGFTTVDSTPGHWVLWKNVWRTAVEMDSFEDTPNPHSVLGMADLSSSRVSLKAVPNAVSVCAAYAELKKNVELIIFGREKGLYVSSVNNPSPDKKAALTDTQILFLIQNLESVGSLVSIISGKDVSDLVIKTSQGMAVAAFDAPSTPVENSWNTLLHCAGLTNGASRWTELIMIGTMSPETYESLAKRKITKTVQTFDLLNVGQKNQFQAGPLIVHNSGFQMGPDKFFATCKRNGTPITMDLAKLGIASYRKEHGRVVALWRAMESAAISAVQTGKPKRAEKVLWFTKGKFLYAQLPSGRRIAYAYPSVKYEMTPWGGERPKLYFWSVDPKTNQWRRGATYGGSLTENVVQGTARDLMVLGQLRTEKQGYIPLFSVHDELVSERVKGEGDLQKFEQQMAVLPEWAQGLPVKVKGYKDVRYRKG